MRRICVYLTMALLAAGGPASAGRQGIAADSWPQVTTRLERAWLEGTLDEMRAVRVELLRRLVGPAEKPLVPQIRYAVAYAGWRMSNRPDLSSKERDDLLNDAVTHMRDVTRAVPEDAEAWTLLGALYSQQIAVDPSLGMVNGLRSAEAFGRAAAADPSNPRLALQRGVSAFFTPPQYGGSIDEAERLLRRSLELLDREAGKPWPNWGRFDAHAWLGQVLVQKGRHAAARAEYEKALAIAPTSEWVRRVLLPAAQK